MTLGTKYKIPPFGRQLKYWRKQKRMSQLDLSFSSGVTPRHLSFIETGRSRPGKNVILRLAQSLGLPLREQNELLKLAGLAPAWHQKKIDSSAMASFHEMLEQMLKNHDPFPALVLDRWWNLVMTNQTAAALFPLPDDGNQPINSIELLIEPGPVRNMIENRQAVLGAVAIRLRKEIEECAGDKKLEALLTRVEIDIDQKTCVDDVDAPVVYTLFKVGDHQLRTVSTIARFSSAKDVFLNELRVEFIYPADDPSRFFFETFSKGLS